MPRFVHAVPVLASLDIARSIIFYVNKLGFRAVLNHEDEYGIVARDGVEVHFWKCNDPEIPKATSCRINVEGIDDLYAQLHPQGVVHPNGKLEEPWNLREFPIVDADGNLITFAERLEHDLR